MFPSSVLHMVMNGKHAETVGTTHHTHRLKCAGETIETAREGTVTFLNSIKLIQRTSLSRASVLFDYGVVEVLPNRVDPSS